MILFMTTTVKTSNPTSDKIFEEDAQLNGGQEEGLFGNVPLTNVYCFSDNILPSFVLSIEVFVKS
jgi:hypothetical protein